MEVKWSLFCQIDKYIYFEIKVNDHECSKHKPRRVKHLNDILFVVDLVLKLNCFVIV